jgi:hypothetical protein
MCGALIVRLCSAPLARKYQLASLVVTLRDARLLQLALRQQL